MASQETPYLEAEKQKQPNILKRTEIHIQRRVISGLFELVPLIVTMVVLVWLYTTIDPAIRNLPFVKDRWWAFPGIGLVALAIVLYLIGLIALSRVGRAVLALISTMMNLIPVVRTLYGVTQQAMRSIGSSANFSRVVFIEWPRDGMVAMGFVTGRARSPGKEEDLVSVYIPTVPNPTSGNMAFVLEDDVVETDMSVEDAMKLIFSGGIVLPESISMARMPRPPRTEDSFMGRYDKEG